MSNLQALERFTKSKDDFKLTKVGSKRTDSMVFEGDSVYGYFRLLEHEGLFAALVVDGSNFIKTSAIIKVVDETEDSTTFETQGGIYKLEQLTK